MFDSVRPATPGPRWACRRCNAEVGATAKFCPGCGATLEL
ncbi:zinc-ribbon domain-containing protein [Oscillochloris sp. ZM17-4]